MLEAGETSGALLEGDIRTDVPLHLVFVTGWWREDLVGFLLGCSSFFERAVLGAGLPVRHVAEDRNVLMHRTSVHVGDPGALGIRDLDDPDVGEAVTVPVP